MALTFKSLQDDVKDECQELAGQADFNDVRIKKMINRGYKQFVKDTKCLTNTLNFTTVANQQYYGTAEESDWAYLYNIIDVKYITESTEFGKELYPYPGGHNKLPRNKAYGEPTSYYTRLSQGSPIQYIGTYPIIDVSSKTLAVRVSHGVTTELSADGDLPLIGDEYRDALVYYAAWRLFKSYGHRNREWHRKALENKTFYKELAGEYKFDNFHIDQLQTVYDVGS